MMRRFHPAGFSMLELSVVLIIITLVVAGGIGLGRTALEGSDRLTTQTRLTTIKTALENFAASNGYLPCPANRALLPTNASFGVETRSGATCTVSGTGVMRAPSAGSEYAFIGTVPVRTLGLPDNYAIDAWSNKMLYAVSANHVGDPNSYATDVGRIIVRFGNLTTYYPLTTNPRGATPSVDSAATFVVVSHGADGKGAFPFKGTSATSSCTNNGVDYENCDDSNVIFYDTAFNDGTNTSVFFDDYIVWGTNLASLASVAPAGCGSNPCAEWCAPCVNTSPYTSSHLCGTILMSTSPCNAYCIWGGLSGSERVPCP